MTSDDLRDKHAEINPARRQDRPGEPHDDLVETGPGADAPAVKPYQDEPLDPLDPGGIGA